VCVCVCVCVISLFCYCIPIKLNGLATILFWYFKEKNKKVGKSMGQIRTQHPKIVLQQL